jgi:hypothetical protein
VLLQLCSLFMEFDLGNPWRAWILFSCNSCLTGALGCSEAGPLLG